MTRGMWSLLTKKEADGYTEDDLHNYKQILYDTNALYQQNDPNTGKPKSSRSSKWALVNPFWVDRPSHKQYDKSVMHNPLNYNMQVKVSCTLVAGSCRPYK